MSYSWPQPWTGIPKPCSNTPADCHLLSHPWAFSWGLGVEQRNGIKVGGQVTCIAHVHPGTGSEQMCFLKEQPPVLIPCWLCIPLRLGHWYHHAPGPLSQTIAPGVCFLDFCWRLDTVTWESLSHSLPSSFMEILKGMGAGWRMAWFLE